MVQGGSHTPHPSGKNDFIIAAYSKQTDGTFKVAVPSRCPCGGDGTPCDVRCHSARIRTTGPGHPLVVIVCVNHKRWFTLYPPGFAPYLRAPLVAERKEGTTLFEAAQQAAEARTAAWPRQVHAAQRPGRYWRTQTRKIAFAAAVLGLVSSGPRDDVADVLDVSLYEHRKAAEAMSHGFRGRGRAIAAVLDEVPAPKLRRLYWAGYRTGVWGRAFCSAPRAHEPPQLQTLFPV